ncbi:MAG TPA: 4-hydroxy-tetrahydrodipicolinate reductase [Bacteroidales bacterium]
MKIILSGYGKMNHEVEKIAVSRGHEIVGKFDNEEDWKAFDSEKIKAELVLDFSQPDVAVSNFKRCFEAGLPVVTGTTGWNEQLGLIKKLCHENNYAFFYSPNFSIGVNVFFSLNQKLAKIMDGLPNYTVKIKESHHAQKLDAPSGTALKTVNDIIENTKRFNKWTGSRAKDLSEIQVHSERVGEVPGTHEVIWESDADSLVLKHEAKNRSGFAFGAVLAAEFLLGKTGVYTMEDLLKSVF